VATVEHVEQEGLNEQRFLLQNVGWQVYDLLLRELGDRPIRLTYSRGDLELMTPSTIHEKYAKLLGRLIEVLTVEMGIEVCNLGSMTCRAEDLDRGLEPDECFYIQNEPAIRDKSAIDLSIDPPPDLAIEIDITSSSLDRQEIYAKIGVRELWRFDGDSLRVFLLNADGQYQAADRSEAFPFLPIEQVPEFLYPNASRGSNATAKQFAEWVRPMIPSSS
jgi:Uma2 family endonuclease